MTSVAGIALTRMLLGCCCRSLLPQNPDTTAGVRQTRDGLVYYLSPSTTAASFMQAQAAFMAAPVEGQSQEGFIPGAEQAAAALLRSMNAGRRLHSSNSSSGSSSSSSSSGSSSSASSSSRSSSSNSTDSSGRSSSSSSQHSRSIRYIIGEDDRQQLPGAAGWPFTAVGQFVFHNGSCSGVMIGPRSVLTAGHCVFNRKLKLWQEDLKFVPFRWGLREHLQL